MPSWSTEKTLPCHSWRAFTLSATQDLSQTQGSLLGPGPPRPLFASDPFLPHWCFGIWVPGARHFVMEPYLEIKYLIKGLIGGHKGSPGAICLVSLEEEGMRSQTVERDPCEDTGKMTSAGS